MEKGKPELNVDIEALQCVRSMYLSVVFQQLQKFTELFSTFYLIITVYINQYHNMVDFNIPSRTLLFRQSFTQTQYCILPLL